MIRIPQRSNGSMDLNFTKIKRPLMTQRWIYTNFSFATSLVNSDTTQWVMATCNQFCVFFYFNLHAHDSRSHLPWCVSVVRTSHDLLCACFKKGKTHILCMKTLKWRRNVLNTQFKIDRIHYITYSQWFNSLVS